MQAAVAGSTMMKRGDALGLESIGDAEVRDEQISSAEMRLIEALVPPRSRLVGQTLRAVGFRDAGDFRSVEVRQRPFPYPVQRVRADAGVRVDVSQLRQPVGQGRKHPAPVADHVLVAAPLQRAQRGSRMVRPLAFNLTALSGTSRPLRVSSEAITVEIQPPPAVARPMERGTTSTRKRRSSCRATTPPKISATPGRSRRRSDPRRWPGCQSLA